MNNFGLILIILGLFGSSMALVLVIFSLISSKWRSILKTSLIMLGVTICCLILGTVCYYRREANSEFVQEQYNSNNESVYSEQSIPNIFETDIDLMEESVTEEPILQGDVSDIVGKNVEDNNTEGKLRIAIENVVGEDRLKDFMYIPENNYTLITFKGSDSLSTNLIVEAAYLDIKDILKNIQNVIDTDVRICVTFPIIDVYGNSQEQMVIKSDYKLDTIKKINFDNFVSENVPYVADVWNDDELFRMQ